MKVQTFNQKFSINNFDSIDRLKINKKFKRHGELFPSSIRSIICGPSNCGKTNLILSLIVQPNGLRFQNVYVYSKSLHQAKYFFLKNILSNMQQDGVNYFEYSNNEDVISPSKSKANSVFIFDDIICEKQHTVKEYFSRGRHNLCDVFFLGQSYSAINKQLLRDNANFIILFKTDERNLLHVFRDHVNTDFSFEKFKELCKMCWISKYGFIVIDKDSEINNGRYRKGFDSFFTDI